MRSLIRSIKWPKTTTAICRMAVRSSIWHKEQEEASFTGLATDTTYHFRLYAYTNSGARIDYNLSNPPEASARTIGGISLELDNEVVSELDGPNAATLTVTLGSEPDSYPLTVVLSDNDDDDSEISIPSSVEITSGLVASVNVDALADATIDANQTVTISASATGFQGSSIDIVVANADLFSSPVRITQYYLGQVQEGVPILGIMPIENRFIELANTSDSAVDLTGWTLALWTDGDTENWKSPGGSPAASLALSGVLNPGETLLIRGADAISPDYAVNGADLVDSSVTGFSGDDSVVLYNTAGVGPENIADALSFTLAGAEGGSGSDPSGYTTIIRLNNDSGFNTNPGSSVLDFELVWQIAEASLADNASLGENEYLGEFVSSSSPEPDPVADYLADFGLTEADLGSDAGDNDGVPVLLEYVIDGDPNAPDALRLRGLAFEEVVNRPG